MEFFATTAKGMEELLSKELLELGISNQVAEAGGVRFFGDVTDCWRANLWLRMANRVLMPLATFSCTTPKELYDGVRTIRWAAYLNPRMTLAVDCNLRDSNLTHSGYVALKTKDAIVDTIREGAGSRPNVDTRDPDLRINVHLAGNRCTVSLDTSGHPLDRRGYRLQRTEAPLRETVAAAIIALSGWNGREPLFDPMCGSGTIPIEAALKAANRAPGLLGRSFGFQRWPGFDSRTWSDLVDETRSRQLDTVPSLIVGSDRSPAALERARANAEVAGVSGLLQLRRLDFADFAPPAGPGIILFNPPYGLRLGEEEGLKPLYKQIGDVMKKQCAGYTAYLLTGSRELAKCVGLKASRRFILFNGPIECRLLKYELY